MVKLKKLRVCKLIADGKELVFKDHVCEVKKVTKDIQFLIDNKYVELKQGGKNG